MRRFRMSCTITLSLIMLTALAASPASAETGIIAFRDDCTGLLYAMRGDGSGRVALLPLLSLPTDRYLQPLVLDVTTSGPTTVVYYTGIARDEVINGQHQLILLDHGVFAVQVDELGGLLMPEPPVRLNIPSIAGVDPNTARQGSFSSVAAGDRLALVGNGPTASVLITAKVERDSNFKIIGLSDFVVVGDLFSIGIPDPNFPTQKGFTGYIDYSPDGRSIVAAIYFDLWQIRLDAANAFLAAERLTDTDGFAEWNPAFSPDGSHVAFTGGAVQPIGGVSSRDMEIYSVALATHVVTSVTSNRNKGSAATLRNNPMWAPDGASIGFTAYTSGSTRRSACSGLVNSEIFLINADGSNTATQITNTKGTSVEAWPKWGS